MQDGCTIRNGYRLDLDGIIAGSRVGMMRCSDDTLHYYKLTLFNPGGFCLADKVPIILDLGQSAFIDGVAEVLAQFDKHTR